MDGLSTMLGQHHGQGAFVLRCGMRAPWSIRIADESALALVVLTRGEAAIVREGETPVTLTVGDVALVKGHTAYVIADRASTPPTVVVGPGQVCTGIDGSEGDKEMVFGLRSWGNAEDGPCEFLVGAYELPGQVSAKLMRFLPDITVLPTPACDPLLIRLMSQEMGRDLPGQGAVLDRYVDLVLVSGLREWFGREETTAPSWWLAQEDPIVGPILALMHDLPERPWTIEALAARVGYSRATVARRFADLVGLPPMAYLTDWRMTLAADLLSTTDGTVESVGRAVGYPNPFTFSTAFKRSHGASPRAFRKAAA